MPTADELIRAGTHVLVPVKADDKVRDAIERYYFSRVLNKGAEKKDGLRRDRVFAQCWQSLMAYCWIVDAFKEQRDGDSH